MRISSFVTAMAVVGILLGAAPAYAQYGGGMVVANGAPVSGVFAPGLPIDPRNNRAYVDYILQITVPGQYQIDLTSANSSAYDPYLYVYQNGVQVAANDDGGGYPNARVRRHFNPGTYVVRASSFRSGMPRMAGHFTLRVSGGQPVGIPAVGMPMPMGGQALFPGVPVQGTFLPHFPVDSNRRPYTDYILNISMPGNYQIDLRSTNSSAYDPYLYLMQNGVPIATNDDGGGYPNSRITRFLAPGVYVVRAASFRRTRVNPTQFSLSVIRR